MDPGQVNGPGITGPVLVPVNECMHELWLGPDMPRRSGSCERTDEGRVCVCTSGDSEDTEPSVERESTAEFCSQALLEVCEIDVLAPNYCEALPGGCWPNDDAGSSWLCACEGDNERVSVAADTCQDALRNGCSETCSDSLGSCVADLQQ